uniref:ADAMTS like 5 n=1 Tax=Takifugu rubripes TaxID=31033 RepID=A0A674MHI9_TAKRU
MGYFSFVINGDWKISIPGEYNVAGTKLLYRRSADTWESFEVPGPTREDLHLMVLATDRNPDIEYEYWLPPDQYALHHGRKSPLRQAHHTANYLPWDEPFTTATTTTRAPPITTRPHWFKGRTERKRQYCRKDFVFRAKVVGKLYRGEETRYDVQVIHTYRNSFRLEHREFIWAPNLCDCPHLEVGRQYILMVRRHINYEHTLNRILLEEDTVPYRYLAFGVTHYPPGDVMTQ